MEISSFELVAAPVAQTAAVVAGAHVRFTLLTPRLIRMEYSPSVVFEDRPSQAFWFRHQPVPAFTVNQTAESIQIETDYLALDYHITSEGITQQTLSVKLKESGKVWHYGERDRENLRGTARTLDGVKGTIRLEHGLMSRKGWALVDDSSSLVFDQNGWLNNRQGQGALDLYFFGYNHDYQGCLNDYAKVSGRTPVIPRWVLGNWWSRYWPYRQEELKALIEDFRQHEVPLSVCIIDMDWHITKTGNESSGWTGYTWNKELFQEPYAFIDWLHQQGLRTALNLHPGDGVYPHEETYPQMADIMGIDPASREPVQFDITDPRFTRAYFDVLHHPMEEKGVDFWWLDWQQGTRSKVTNLDPLWWLNHLHFNDLGRDGKKRPFIFSRWGGLGNQRYPIGFSGDTVVSWESLAFQPYFTSTAANVGYGWWSHDIGGHMGGKEDGELYTRWVQFGVFSPILRLHSTYNAYQDRRPWGYDSDVLRVVRGAMQLRHAFIPYLYSMAWRNTLQNVPLITPMYHAYPEDEEAYHCQDQYIYGSELLVAPFLTPRNAETRLSRGSVWIPGTKETSWFNFFTGERLSGGRWYAQYGELEDIPVFARAGAIVPLGPRVAWGGVDNPLELNLLLFPGADNTFELVEDDGSANPYEGEHVCRTVIEQLWEENELQLTVNAVQGNTAVVPAERVYHLLWRGVREPETIELQINGKFLEAKWEYDQAHETLRIANTPLSSRDTLKVRLAVSQGSLISGRDRIEENCRKLLHAFNLDSGIKAQIESELSAIKADPSLLARYQRHLSEAQIGALLQTLNPSSTI